MTWGTVRLNLVTEGASSVESEEASRSEDDRLISAAISKLIERKYQKMMVDSCQQIKEFVRKVVKEEIESSKSNKKRKFASLKWTNTNSETVSNERSLHLKFLNDVSDDVLTGKEIKGKGDVPIKVAIFDEAEQIVGSGPESSAKVEILLLATHENDNEHKWTHEEFNSRIINECDKTKPNFVKRYHVYLDKGIGELRNAKLAQYSIWTKSSKCRLGARVMENFNGVKVREGWTKPFIVSDSRGKLYGKHFPPSLSDEVWRLVHIGRDGEPHKRLKMNNISTVEEFLFLCSINPRKLQEIVGAPAKAWKAIENHAQTCVIEDTRIFLYTDSSKGNMSVVFDVVANLKGMICNSQYVVESCLSEDEKDRARDLLQSAFENRKHIISIGEERSLVQQYPYRASNAPVNASNQKSFHIIDAMSEHEDLVNAPDTRLSIGSSVLVRGKY